MSLITNIRDYLDEPGRNIVVVTIDDIQGSYDDLQEFIRDANKFLGEGWETEVQRRGVDHGEGKRIVLSMYPNNLKDHSISGKRIYIIENADELTHALTFHQIRP